MQMHRDHKQWEIHRLEREVHNAHTLKTIDTTCPRNGPCDGSKPSMYWNSPTHASHTLIDSLGRSTTSYCCIGESLPATTIITSTHTPISDFFSFPAKDDQDFLESQTSIDKHSNPPSPTVHTVQSTRMYLIIIIINARRLHMYSMYIHSSFDPPLHHPTKSPLQPMICVIFQNVVAEMQ